MPGHHGSHMVCVNKAGTFGGLGASYAYFRCGEKARTMFLVRISSEICFCWRSGIGVGCKWAKTTKGFQVEWLGMETGYNSCRVGLTVRCYLTSRLAERQRDCPWGLLATALCMPPLSRESREQ